MLKLLQFTAKLCVLCPMLIGVVLSLMELLLLPVCQLSVYVLLFKGITVSEIAVT